MSAVHQPTIAIRCARSGELDCLYQLVTSNELWSEFNGPYFPYMSPTIEEFAATSFERMLLGQDMQLITIDDRPVGTVNSYWECEATRLLEAGVVLYDEKCWGKGIAAQAVPLWISALFARHDIERVGMTTWSGNPRMMALAEKVGLTLEARLRKVRFHKGVYYDSVKYGVLRSEWNARQA
ncbi:GNAT family N-acetyltransferase [Vibrio astriarenae]|uniref:GNAT family N-acetyltransferase n=1 Tax=Vibrio astriarenae TaxID=1481923 RepID=A0A7Z2T889_9VIBR|nr:GNAT family protein [Vibrio astriarenae]QIA66056.1 GNAT family N-acetyltransferase [Vibrio astriarenae]